MGLLLGVTVAAFDSIGKGAKMRSALMQMKAGLSLARQYAITDRRAAYVVFPDKDTEGGPDPSRHEAVYQGRYQSYYVMNQDGIEDKTTSEGDTLIRRVHFRLGRWQHLPKGIVFDRDSRPSDLEFTPGIANNMIDQYANIFFRPLSQEPVYSNNVFVLPFPGMTNTSFTHTQSVVAIAFSANGRLIQNVQSVRWTPMIILSEGAVQMAADGTEQRYFMSPGSSKFSVEILPLTGRIRIREIYAK
jgi:Tfp pilus assembly protein FimT